MFENHKHPRLERVWTVVAVLCLFLAASVRAAGVLALSGRDGAAAATALLRAEDDASPVVRVQAAVVREEMAAVTADLERTRGRTEELTVRSPLGGTFVLPGATDLPGRFVRQGEVVGYVVQPPDLTARVVVSQDEIGLVRDRVEGAELMLAEYGAEGHPASVLREVPGGTSTLPTPALGTQGGGDFAVDPRDPEGRRTLQRVFELEVALPAEVARAHLGTRVFVRLDHGTEPLGFQIYRSLRQLLLRQFGV